MNEACKVNIQSTAGIMHHMFGRISYKPWYAIAEFVDNSSQSFFTNADKMNSINQVTIRVDYDKDNSILTIQDNAYGMNLEELTAALYVEGGKVKKSGRNEFGSGLKTAAGWFGEKWSITTTKYDSGKQYIAVIDIANLENDISIYQEDVDLSEHGTIIRIEKVTKKLTAPKTISKIKELLSSMYRRDINSGKVHLEYNGERIYFDSYPVLSNFRGREWKKDVKFSFEFENKTYNVDGFVAIMDPGSFVKAGLALFRRDRVIIGGADMNYKPTEIFGQQQSQRSLKLFGELNMDDFPVNQAKDGFVWDDGLEEAFIEKLKENIQDYILIADISKTDRAKEEMYSVESSENVEQDVKKHIDGIEQSLQDIARDESNNSVENVKKDDIIVVENNDEMKQSIEEFQKELQQKDSVDDEKIVGKTRHYQVQLNEVRTLSINVDWSINHRKYWIDINNISPDQIKLLINIDHPFFRPYSNQEDFKIVIEKFVIAFVVAEVTAKMTSDKEGYIIYKSIRDKMNEYLAKMGE